MHFASNLQFLRRRSGMTQEKLASHLGVSRQAISKWESGETLPEVATLLQLSQLFSCNMDDLLRQELSRTDSPVEIVNVKGFTMARHRVISSNAAKDLQELMNHWANRQGLENPTLLLWSFPYVSQEQKQRFSLEGFEAACILPEDFTPVDSSYPLSRQDDCTYALLTIEEPEGRSSLQIARGIRTILEALEHQGIRKSAKEGFLPCFERRYVRDGVAVAELFLQCQDAGYTKTITLK